MYDCIIQCSPLLPAGVTLAEVLQGSAAADVKEIVASLPDSGTISAAAMISAGTARPAAMLLQLWVSLDSSLRALAQRNPLHWSLQQTKWSLGGRQICCPTAKVAFLPG